MDDMESTIPASAAAKVFNIPELLENILLHLSMRQLFVKQLFVVQRVDWKFQGVITGSEKLRRLMFLAHKLPHKHGVRQTRFNPLLRDGGIPLLACLYFFLHYEGAINPRPSIDAAFHFDVSEQEMRELEASRDSSWRSTRLVAGAEKADIDLLVRAGDSVTSDSSTLETVGQLADWAVEW
ncbi:hypothetical protein LTR36_006664 [Oleoguttula mirabilis]|uniref:F-box domain-containing protein n=1 Tax=Oleoguttula mirabilis TaxID=1507867 RepID=A0AAV9JC11_9PEZI|nr:hypothetical protein LTR36_006664 [Oleoguttula mirabilis]